MAMSPVAVAVVLDVAVAVQEATSFPVQKSEVAGTSLGDSLTPTGTPTGIPSTTSSPMATLGTAAACTTLADFTGENGDPAYPEVQAEEDSHDGLDKDLPTINADRLGD